MCYKVQVLRDETFQNGWWKWIHCISDLLFNVLPIICGSSVFVY